MSDSDPFEDFDDCDSFACESVDYQTELNKLSDINFKRGLHAAEEQMNPQAIQAFHSGYSIGYKYGQICGEISLFLLEHPQSSQKTILENYLKLFQDFFSSNDNQVFLADNGADIPEKITNAFTICQKLLISSFSETKS